MIAARNGRQEVYTDRRGGRGSCTPDFHQSVAADPGMGLVRAVAAFLRIPQGESWGEGRTSRKVFGWRDLRTGIGVGLRRTGLVAFAAEVASAPAAS